MTDFDNFVTHGIPADFDSDSDDEIKMNFIFQHPMPVYISI